MMLITFCGAAHASSNYDFDGDGISDFGIHRNVPSGTTGTFLKEWWIARSGDNGAIVQQFGYSVNGGDQDSPLVEDYDGDGKADIAVVRFRPTDQQLTYFILNSSNGTVRFEDFGISSDAITPTGDWDGDGKADPAVYRKAVNGSQSAFIYRGSLNNPNGNVTFVVWGNSLMEPLKGDFDGDGKADTCVRSSATGAIYLRRSSDGGIEYINFGLAGDTPFTGDFDGDGKTDFCMRRSDGTNFQWYILERDGGGTGGSPIAWGISNASILFDFTFAGPDFDGDGKSDIATYRPGNPGANRFLVRKSSDGQMLSFQWGTSSGGGNFIYR